MYDTYAPWRSFVLGTVVVLALLVTALWGFPRYRVYAHTLRGEAQLREAEYTRQIAVLDAQAEVERARGVAQANQIIGNSLKGNEAYLRYLWIQGTQNNQQQVIYVPTEANLPILEATRRAAPAPQRP